MPFARFRNDPGKRRLRDGETLLASTQGDNYLDRWLAFAAIGVPMESLLRDDLFLMLRHGSTLFAEEIRLLPASEPESCEWRTFSQLLNRVRLARDTPSLPELRKALSAVRAAQPSSSSPAPSKRTPPSPSA